MCAVTPGGFIIVKNQTKFVWKQQVIQRILNPAKHAPREPGSHESEVNIRTPLVNTLAREPKSTARSTAGNRSSRPAICNTVLSGSRVSDSWVLFLKFAEFGQKLFKLLDVVGQNRLGDFLRSILVYKYGSCGATLNHFHPCVRRARA